MNVDNIFINMLKQANVSLDLKNATPEERSQQAKSMAAANKEFKGEIANVIQGKESFILDGTAASLRNTLKLKDELQEAGYEVFMLYVYTDLERSLKQNQDRFEKSDGEDRSLAPAIVLKTWKGVTDNLPEYAKVFGDNFVAVANTLEDQKLQDIEKIVTKYLDPYKPTGTKPKTAKQIEKSKKDKAELNSQIQNMLSNEFLNDVIEYTVSKEEAQSRLNQFING